MKRAVVCTVAPAQHRRGLLEKRWALEGWTVPWDPGNLDSPAAGCSVKAGIRVLSPRTDLKGARGDWAEGACLEDMFLEVAAREHGPAPCWGLQGD